MKTTELPAEKNIIALTDVPQEIKNVNLNPLQRDMLAKGDLVFLEAMHLEDGRLVDGKVKLSKNENGEVQIHVYEKKPILEIPDEIMSYKLSRKEKEDLMAEKTVGIKTNKGEQFYIQIDKELNRVMVKTERDLSRISEIGKYKLSTEDKIKWANGEKLPTKIFFDEKTGSFFSASIRKTDNSKGIEYHDYKSLAELDKEKVSELIKKYNSTPTVIGAVLNATESIKTENITLDQKHTTIEVNTSQDNDRRFVQYSNNKDYEGLKRLANEGYKPEKQLIEQTAAQLNWSGPEKDNIMSALKVDTKKDFKVNDPVILELTGKPYRVLEVSDNGTKLLLADNSNKKVGVSVDHVHLMSKAEKGLYLGTQKNITKTKSLEIH